jgi:hypothetical protein
LGGLSRLIHAHAKAQRTQRVILGIKTIIPFKGPFSEMRLTPLLNTYEVQFLGRVSELGEKTFASFAPLREKTFWRTWRLGVTFTPLQPASFRTRDTGYFFPDPAHVSDISPMTGKARDIWLPWLHRFQPLTRAPPAPVRFRQRHGTHF